MCTQRARFKNARVNCCHVQDKLASLIHLHKSSHECVLCLPKWSVNLRFAWVARRAEGTSEVAVTMRCIQVAYAFGAHSTMCTHPHRNHKYLCSIECKYYFVPRKECTLQPTTTNQCKPDPVVNALWVPRCGNTLSCVLRTPLALAVRGILDSRSIILAPRPAHYG